MHLRPDVEDLAEFVEERFLDNDSEQTCKAKKETEDLQERMEILNNEVNSKKGYLETAQRQQAKFSEQCRHLNAVLQDAEEKMSPENVEELHEQGQCFEVGWHGLPVEAEKIAGRYLAPQIPQFSTSPSL